MLEKQSILAKKKSKLAYRLQCLFSAFFRLLKRNENEKIRKIKPQKATLPLFSAHERALARVHKPNAQSVLF